MFIAISTLSNKIYYFINVVIITNKIALLIENIWRRKGDSRIKLKVVHFPLWVVAAVHTGSHPKT